jgi:pyruvate-formate lyase-activating enzyme
MTFAPDDATVRRLRKALTPPSAWGNAKITHRRVQNFVQAQLEQAAGATELQSLPVKLTVESTNLCNLRCVACPTGDERRGRPTGHMSLELYSWLMRELGPTLFEVELHNWGEPLLGREVYSFVELAHRAGVSSTISTNFSLPFDEQRAERLIESGLGVLGVSIDGASQQAYEQYRVRGDLERVLANCRLVRDAKKRLGSRTPALYWSFRVFSHNAHEVEVARRIAGELEMNFVATRGWVIGSEDPALSTYQYPWADGFPDRCYFLWFQAVVHHDGGVAPCCCTFYKEDDFTRLELDPGRLETTSFRDVWNGKQFAAARGLFRARAADHAELACYDCPETTDFERWKVAIAEQARDFRRTSSNDFYNYFWRRRPADGGLVALRRSAKSD